MGVCHSSHVNTTVDSNPVKTIFSYEEYKHNLLPFDLILFKGTDCVSKTIQRVQRKKLGIPNSDDAFSHVGIVVTSDILEIPKGLVRQSEFRESHFVKQLSEKSGNQRSVDTMTSQLLLKPGEKYVWESTMSGPLADGVRNVNHKSFLGVQLRNLDEVIREYGKPCCRTPCCMCTRKRGPGSPNIAVCHLRDNPFTRMTLNGDTVAVTSSVVDHLVNNVKELIDEKTTTIFDSEPRRGTNDYVSSITFHEYDGSTTTFSENRSATGALKGFSGVGLEDDAIGKQRMSGTIVDKL